MRPTARNRSLGGEDRTKYAYDAYGERTAALEEIETSGGFTGRRHDDSGLVANRLRYYAPTQGLWISRDPLGMRDSPNRYLYAVANPVSYAGRSGGDVVEYQGFTERELPLLRRAWGEAKLAMQMDLAAAEFGYRNLETEEDELFSYALRRTSDDRPALSVYFAMLTRPIVLRCAGVGELDERGAEPRYRDGRWEISLSTPLVAEVFTPPGPVFGTASVDDRLVSILVHEAVHVALWGEPDEEDIVAVRSYDPTVYQLVRGGGLPRRVTGAQLYPFEFVATLSEAAAYKAQAFLGLTNPAALTRD